MADILTHTTRKERTAKFYDDVRSEFLRLYGQQKDGKRIYTTEYIFTLLAKKFYRSERTIENIVFNRV